MVRAHHLDTLFSFDNVSLPYRSSTRVSRCSSCPYGSEGQKLILVFLVQWSTQGSDKMLTLGVQPSSDV